MNGLTASTVVLRRYDLPTALRIARDLGFDSIDLVGLRGLCEHIPVMGTEDEWAAAELAVLASDLRPVSVNADPGSFDGVDDPAAVMRRAQRAIAFTRDVGAPLLVLPCGEKGAADDPRVVAPEYARMADGINRLAVDAAVAGIRLAVEAPYFGRPVDTVAATATLAEMLRPDVELAFDTSHVAGAGEDVLDAWREFGPRVGVIHLRDAVAGDIRRVIGHGDIDFAALLAAVDASEFSGDVVLELETRNSPYASKEDELLAAATQLGAMRSLALQS